MKTKQIYYEDPYKGVSSARILSIEESLNLTNIILDQTIFYPEGGGQPSDQGDITGPNGKMKVNRVIIKNDEILHIGKVTGQLVKEDSVKCSLDWERRYKNMKVHTAGHILHEAVKQLFPELIPIEGEHGKKPFIKYRGYLDSASAPTILKKTNELIEQNLPIHTEFVTLNELKKRSVWIPSNLPKNKPLSIMWIGNFAPIPDGGTQVKNTTEVGQLKEVSVFNEGGTVFVFYKISEPIQRVAQVSKYEVPGKETFNAEEIINLKNEVLAQIVSAKSAEELENIRAAYLGRCGRFTAAIKKIKDLPQEEKKQAGILINDAKNAIESEVAARKNSFKIAVREWFDSSVPGIKPKVGHLHLITQAINDISRTFEKIGFVRARYPEVEWDWFAFEALNMPKNHPARDEWETFFVTAPPHPRFGQMVLTPHTSSGQIREMLRVRKTLPDKEQAPIRMINIAKCYRRQLDVSHTPMFHQFEGLVIGQDISIINLKGTLDYFARNYFGQDRKTRLRPYHFQFTEPSFEVDVSCGVCQGKGCKLCKEGWLELGGAGMVHPQVLKNGGTDPERYSGFAFGWGVERVIMMKSGLKIPDLRILYSPNLGYLRQF